MWLIKHFISHILMMNMVGWLGAMKTLSLEFSFKSDYCGVWIIAPLGTKIDGCGNYSFEQKNKLL